MCRSGSKMEVLLSKIKHLVQGVLVLSILLVGFNDCYSMIASDGYFYQKEHSSWTNKNSCSSSFEELINSRSRDDSVISDNVIYNLNYLNTHYLLEDYDDALSPNHSKFMDLNELISEVNNKKREMYCKIEMAIYLKDNFASPLMDSLLKKPLEILDITYSSAMKSFRHDDFKRAKYAFDLIAPYRDSYQKYLESSKELVELLVVEEIPVLADMALPAATITHKGPIAMAFKAGLTAPTDKPGPITRLAKVVTAITIATTKKSPGPIAILAQTLPTAKAPSPGPILTAATGRTVASADILGPIATAAKRK